MNFVFAVVTLVSVANVHCQQDKGNSIIPFPRVGRAERLYAADKRNGNQPGLIPFPRIGRDGGGIHESKRQLIPFPRVGKRAHWHFPMDPYAFEYEDYPYGFSDSSFNGMPSSDPSSLLEPNEEKRGPAANNGGMWFGPRLGRKKRSLESADSSEHSRETLDTRTLVKILHNFNWAIVPVKERRTFTPRLGRSSEEMTMHRRSQPISPRLGRSREATEIEGEEEEPTQQPQMNGAPISPRLGRDHYSPRLGRSGENHK